MERLRNQVSSTDAVLAEAAKLVRSASVGEAPVGLEQRIRAGIQARQRRRTAMRLQPVVVGLVLVGLVAVSGATVLGIWVRRHAATPAPMTFPSIGVTPRRTPQAPPTTESPPPVTAPIAPEVESPRPPARALPRTRPSVSHVEEAPLDDTPQAPAVPAPAPQAAPAAVAPAAPLALDPEAALVLDATRALHHGHNPRLAIRLLDQYLRQYPEGDLIEESLALAIEARSVRGDSGAAALAADYLRRFPTGRFRAAALAALARFAK